MTYNGQEAILAGAPHAMDTDKDRMITVYRNHVMPIGLELILKKLWQTLWKNWYIKWIRRLHESFQKNIDFMVVMNCRWTKF